MKRLVQILTVTTFAFALSTAYYARALKQQRSRNPGVAASATLQPVSGQGATSAPGNAAGTASANILTQDYLEIKAIAARQRLERFNDPAEHTKNAARKRTSIVETWWKTVAESMQLPSQEQDRLLDTLTEQSLARDRRRLECQIDPTCDSQALEASLKISYREELAHTLGPAGFESWKAYSDAIPERVIVDELRKNLPSGSALSDAEAEHFVMALADERHKIVERAAQQGRKVQVSTAGFTVQDFQGDVAPKPFGPSNKEMTKDFNSRIRSRAAQNLSREQLEEFTKMQDERVKNAALMEALSARPRK